MEFVSHEYASYMWNIVLSYFKNLKELRTYDPVKKLEKHILSLGEIEGANWFRVKICEIKREYMTYIGKPKTISDSVGKYNSVWAREFIEIADREELFEKIQEILNKDVRRWVEGEGAYEFLSLVGLKLEKSSFTDSEGKAAKKGFEDLIQKTIKTQFVNALLANGFRSFDIDREPQLLDGRKVDFKISYGLIGSVLIEIKLTTNSDLCGKPAVLKTKHSFKNLKKYLEGYTTSTHGIFLVFDNKRRGKRQKELHRFKIKEAYGTIPNLSVIILDCAPLN